MQVSTSAMPLNLPMGTLVTVSSCDTVSRTSFWFLPHKKGEAPAFYAVRKGGISSL